MSDEGQPYRSPAERQLKDTLAKHGHVLSPEIRAMVETAISSLDHTDPKAVRELLPPSVLEFLQFTSVRAHALVPLIAKAHEGGFFIEAIVLEHGLVQFSLRGLYVLAWQRAVMPIPLTAEQLAPFYEHNSKKGAVHWLVEALQKNGLLQGEHHAKHLMMVNDVRNRAAHGVIFGEIDVPSLKEHSDKCQSAALGALEWFRAWFNNPRPLKIVPRQ